MVLADRKERGACVVTVGRTYEVCRARGCPVGMTVGAGDTVERHVAARRHGGRTQGRETTRAGGTSPLVSTECHRPHEEGATRGGGRLVEWLGGPSTIGLVAKAFDSRCAPRPGVGCTIAAGLISIRGWLGKSGNALVAGCGTGRPRVKMAWACHRSTGPDRPRADPGCCLSMSRCVAGRQVRTPDGRQSAQFMIMLASFTIDANCSLAVVPHTWTAGRCVSGGSGVRSHSGQFETG